MINDSKEHLMTVDETYFQHLKEATMIGLLMIAGGIQALLHGLCPGILKTSASDKIKDLHNKVSKRN